MFPFPLLCLVLGLVLARWKAERKNLLAEADALRLHLHRLEEEQVRLLMDYQDAQQLSQLEERSHIAQILHDSLGHELTASHLSPQMVRSVLETGGVGRAKESRDKAIDRLERSLGQLKWLFGIWKSDPEVERSRLDALLKEFAYRWRNMFVVICFWFPLRFVSCSMPALRGPDQCCKACKAEFCTLANRF